MARRQTQSSPTKSKPSPPPPPAPSAKGDGPQVIKPKVWPLFDEGEVYTFGEVIRPPLLEGSDVWNEMVYLMDHCYSNARLMEVPGGVSVGWACRFVRRFSLEDGGVDRVPLWLLFSDNGNCYCVRSPGMVDALDLVLANVHQPFVDGLRIRLDRVPTKSGFERFTVTFLAGQESIPF